MPTMKSDELNATMKESPGRYTNPFLSDEENEEVNLWNSPEPGDDFTISPEDEEFIKSLASLNVPSEKANHFYTDKNVTECELPELTISYKENGFHFMKDICVDEGLPHGEKVLIDEVFCSFAPVNGDGDADPQFPKHTESKSPSVQDSYANGDSCFGIEEKVDTDLSKDTGNPNDTEVFPTHNGQSPPRGKNDEEDASQEDGGGHESKGEGDEDDGPSACAPGESKTFVESGTVENVENCGPGDPVQAGGAGSDSSVGFLIGDSTERLVHDGVLFSEQDRELTSGKVLESSNNGVDDVDQPPYQSPVGEISKNPFVGSKSEELRTIDETADPSDPNNADESITSGTGPTIPATSSDTHGAESVQEPPVETQAAPTHRDVATLAHQLQHHGDGESSFSVAADPVSASVISYSPVPFSGSISLRSDSSTTSVRSFAFPILQTEWNSSPVRMAKAERNRLQKHRGWRHAFLCCRF